MLSVLVLDPEGVLDTFIPGSPGSKGLNVLFPTLLLNHESIKGGTTDRGLSAAVAWWLFIGWVGNIDYGAPPTYSGNEKHAVQTLHMRLMWRTCILHEYVV